MANSAVMSPPGRVDVDVDVLVRVLGLEVQQLGADQVGDRVVDRRAQEDDVLLEQPASRGRSARSPRLVCSTTVGIEVVADRLGHSCVSSCSSVRRRSSSASAVGSCVVGRRRPCVGRLVVGSSGSEVGPVDRFARRRRRSRRARPASRGPCACGARRAARARRRCARSALRTCVGLLLDAARRCARTRPRGRRRRPRCSSASATARRARSTLTASVGGVPQLLDELGLVLAGGCEVLLERRGPGPGAA